ncbi:MAG: hypothetical protein WKF56_07240 [Candidatus Limnocylindrales bacterium]
MSLARLWLFLAVALPMLAALIANLSSVDLTYHLRAGAQILDSRIIPDRDTWTFTAAGHPWVDQQWAAQAILALAERGLGWTGLVLLRALLVGFIFGGVALIAVRRGLPARIAALLTLAAFVVSASALALRPQLLGMACFVAVLLLLTDRRAHPGRLWLIPLVVAFWANLHGSFLFGPLVLGLAWLEDLHDWRPAPHRVLAVAALSAVAACLTPFGPSVWAYAVGLSVNPEVTSRITEWQPTSLRDVPGMLFFASVAAVVVLLARRTQRVSWPTLLWLGIFAAIGTYAIRGVAWWPIAAAVAASGLLAPSAITRDLIRAEPPLMRRLNLAVSALVVAAGVAVLPAWRPSEPGLETPAGVVGNAPPGITAAIRQRIQPGDRLFNPQPWGSWFEYALPNLPVALDSRIELFPSTVWDEYERVVDGAEGWQERLASWDVSMVVVGPTDFEFSSRLARAGWSETYRGLDGALFIRGV